MSEYPSHSKIKWYSSLTDFLLHIVHIRSFLTILKYLPDSIFNT